MKDLFKHKLPSSVTLEAMDNGLEFSAASMVEKMTKTIQNQLKTCINAVAEQMKLDITDNEVSDKFKLINEHALNTTGLHLRYSLFFAYSHIGMIEIKAKEGTYESVFTPNKNN